MNIRRNIFNEKYEGPTGPHLNCLTETSRFGNYTEERQKSIHPFGRTAKYREANRRRHHAASVAA